LAFEKLSIRIYGRIDPLISQNSGEVLGNGKRILLWQSSLPRHSVKRVYREYNFALRPYLWRVAREIPHLVPFLIPSGPDQPPKAAIIVAPGGGYMGRAAHEGAPVARWLNSLGVNAFVLHYRHAPFRHPIPFLDAQRAIRLVRSRALEFGIDPNRIGMLGFSAGGHLTSTIGTLQKRVWFPQDYIPDAIDAVDDTLQLMILCYPVISMQNMTHIGSRYNLLGKVPDPTLLNLLSTEAHITPKTPPTFLWTTKTDASVTYQHSEWFANGLHREGIDHRFHLFDHGRHGLGLAEDDPVVGQWTKFCAEWLQKHQFRN
jgi:acetyl esterase/lipase